MEGKDYDINSAVKVKMFVQKKLETYLLFFMGVYDAQHGCRKHLR